MAIRYWQPKASAVAQVSTASIDSVDASPATNTFTITIGGVSISVAGDTDANTTAVALKDALEASAHPYFAEISWTAPGSGQVVGTGDVAGVPFTAALAVSGAGTGTVTDFAETAAPTSVHDVGSAENWGGTLPTASDNVIVANSSVSLLYGLEALSAVILSSVVVKQSFTGKIGLEQSGFAKTTVNAETRDAEVPEYRPHYWEIQADSIVGGRKDGTGSSNGSERIKINNTRAAASLLRVENTGSAGELGKPAFRYLAAHADADVEVALAPGGVGIAADVPGETSTVGDIHVVDSAATGSRVIVSDGVTYTNYEQRGGANSISAASGITINKIAVHGGSLDVGGKGYLVSTLEVNAGTVRDTHTRSAGVEWTTILMQGGELDLGVTQQARTVTNLNMTEGAVKASWDDLTVTSLTEPTGYYSMTFARL